MVCTSFGMEFSKAFVVLKSQGPSKPFGAMRNIPPEKVKV